MREEIEKIFRKSPEPVKMEIILDQLEALLNKEVERERENLIWKALRLLEEKLDTTDLIKLQAKLSKRGK